MHVLKKCTIHSKNIDLPLNIVGHSQNTQVDHFALLKEDEKQNELNFLKIFLNLVSKFAFVPFFSNCNDQIKKKPKLFLHFSNASPLVCVLRMSLYIVKVFYYSWPFTVNPEGTLEFEQDE